MIEELVNQIESLNQEQWTDYVIDALNENNETCFPDSDISPDMLAMAKFFCSGIVFVLERRYYVKRRDSNTIDSYPDWVKGNKEAIDTKMTEMLSQWWKLLNNNDINKTT